jgi:excisionase family DNA binding protein
MTDEFLTVAQVADLLKISEQTVRNWIDAGKLRGIRAGARRVRIARADLDAFLEASTRPRRAAPPDKGELEPLRRSLMGALAAVDAGDRQAVAVALLALADAARGLAAVLREGS